MSDYKGINKEPMLEMFIFETIQLIEQLEEILLETEKTGAISTENINEIFRCMHTIKGSSAMMMFDNISALAHSLEDLFYFIRENKPTNLNFTIICDLMLSASDFIKNEISKINDGQSADGSETDLVTDIKQYLLELKGSKEIDLSEEKKIEKPNKFYISSYGNSENVNLKKYKAKIYFEDDCQMENVRAFLVVHALKEECEEIFYIPKDIVENDETSEYIVKNGFTIFFASVKEEENLKNILKEALFVKSCEMIKVDSYDTDVKNLINTDNTVGIEQNVNIISSSQIDKEPGKASKQSNLTQNLISVNINKLDKLMDIVGEITIMESMVTRNPDLEGLTLDNFNKSARQLRKLSTELQDIVMSIRMIPIAATFHKMNRIVRDMCKKLNKEAELVIVGEETEVDKNIIDNLSDPLMHLIRNAIDHGMESVSERIEKAKPGKGKIILEAKNSGKDVWITVKDDGKGLNKEKILSKARNQGLIYKPENELSDREIYSFILLPGFSTKESVTEFSGRGVGMDVVKKNIEKVGGTIIVESQQGEGTTISIKIPLTLAIINGMEVSVGKSMYTIPIASIKESFRAKLDDIIRDSQGNELTMIRGQCYPIFRLHEVFKVKTDIPSIEEGITILVESDSESFCIFVDKLLGEQQVVVKSLPKYLKRIEGISGCTILGDGSISLIVDISSLVNRFK